MSEKKRTSVYNPEADKRWNESNKEHRQYLTDRTSARRFIRKKATPDDLNELQEMISARRAEIKEEIKMEIRYYVVERPDYNKGFSGDEEVSLYNNEKDALEWGEYLWGHLVPAEQKKTVVEVIRVTASAARWAELDDEDWVMEHQEFWQDEPDQQIIASYSVDK